MNILYIDVETTGLDPIKNGIHQVAGIIEINEITLEIFEYKVKPFSDDIIIKEALNISGTKESDFEKDEYYNPEDVINMIQKITSNYFEDGKIIYFCAHNAKFDFNFMDEWFKKCGFFGFTNNKKKLCTLEMAKDQQGKYGWKANKLTDVARYFKYNFKSHNALEDVKACQFIHQKLNTEYYNDLF